MVIRQFFFSVAGTPRPQGSKRVVRGRLLEASRHVAAWREAVRQAATEAMPDGYEPHDGQVEVSLVFLMPRPKGHVGARGLRPSAPTSPLGRPDVDKLARAVLDALTGVIFRDDSQVVLLTASKEYAAPDIGGEPGVHIGVSCL